jgi:hypothetical protein
MVSSEIQNGNSAADIVTPSATVELSSTDAWYELIREIVAMANAGGGRVEVRCIAENGADVANGCVFSAPIKSAARPKPSESVPQPVRIVNDPDAPALQPQDVDHLYPWRQKDLLRELNSRLGRRFLNSYDIQAVRRQHHLDDRPDFVFNLPGAGRRYSPAVADWIIDQHTRDPEFFHHARTADHEIMKLRRHKPK